MNLSKTIFVLAISILGTLFGRALCAFEIREEKELTSAQGDALMLDIFKKSKIVKVLSFLEVKAFFVGDQVTGSIRKLQYNEGKPTKECALATFLFAKKALYQDLKQIKKAVDEREIENTKVYLESEKKKFDSVRVDSLDANGKTVISIWFDKETGLERRTCSFDLHGRLVGYTENMSLKEKKQNSEPCRKNEVILKGYDLRKKGVRLNESREVFRHFKEVCERYRN